jgi:hypothetical protein
MKNLKRLGLSVTLLCVLSLTTLAGETDSPPCAPGETDSPPCAAAQVTPNNPVAPGETDSPPASSAVDAASATELAVGLLQSVLLIF